MDLSNIAEVEKVFQEFYDPMLSNQRKIHLEQIIGHIKSQPNAWVNARYYISKSNSQYLLFAAMTIYEDMIKNGKWDSIPIEDQTDIRNLLLEFLLAKNKIVPSYVCNKVAKVIVDIGKSDWPHKFPDFFNNVMRLMQSGQTHAIGVNMITLMSEEFVTQKDDLLDTRKVQLKNQLMSCLPQILHQLNTLLGAAYDQARINAGQSPVHRALSPLGPLSPSSPVQQSSPVQHLSPQQARSPTGLHFDRDSQALAKAIFDTLEKLFSWIPLSDFVNMGLVNTLFQYAQIGDANGVAALGCINEILSKSYVPREFEDFLRAVFHQLVIVLQNLTQSPMMMQSAEPEYLDRVTYFASLLVRNHLRRVKTSPNFPVLDFLRLLFSYTFSQPMSDTNGFASCLEIWGSFLDILSSSPAEDRRVYFEGLMALQLELQKKVLFNTNANQLNTLDNVGESSSKMDEEEESGSEFDMFISRCLEIISKVAELFPHEVVESLYPLFGQNLDNYFRVAAVVQSNGYSQTVGNVIMDMGTVTRLFGRLVNIFVMDFEAKFQPTVLLYTKMLEMLQYALASNLMSLPVVPDFICRVLGSIHAFSHWLEAYTMHAQIRTAGSAAHGYNDYMQLITRILDTTTPLLAYVQQNSQSQSPAQSTSPIHKSPLTSLPRAQDKTIAQKYAVVGVQVGHVLESLCASVRPPMLVGLPPFEALVNGLHGVAPHLPTTCAEKLYNAVSAAILFPQPSTATSAQQWEAKRAKFLPFIKVLTNAYVEVSQIPGFVDNKIFAQEEVQRRIIFTGQMLASIVRFVNNEPTQVKTIVFEGLGDSLTITLGFFRVYVAAPQQTGLPVLEHILDFFLAAFEALPAQVGAPFTQQTLNTFLEKLSEQKQGVEGGMGGGGRGGKETSNVVMAKLLQILTVVMNMAGSKYEMLLPAVIAFCLDRVFPNLNANTAMGIEVRNQFFTLLHSLLLHHWKAAGNMHVAIIKALETPFTSHDVGLTKQVLDAFESLNSKMRLYSKDIFMEQNHRFTLLQTLFYVLLGKTHDNLRDELIITIYNIAAVDFDSFFKQFLGGFLGSTSGLNDPQRHHLLSNFAHDKDQPTFNSHITQFINDYRYFMNRNVSP